MRVPHVLLVLLCVGGGLFFARVPSSSGRLGASTQAPSVQCSDLPMPMALQAWLLRSTTAPAPVFLISLLLSLSLSLASLSLSLSLFLSLKSLSNAERSIQLTAVLLYAHLRSSPRLIPDFRTTVDAGATTHGPAGASRSGGGRDGTYARGSAAQRGSWSPWRMCGRSG